MDPTHPCYPLPTTQPTSPQTRFKNFSRDTVPLSEQNPFTTAGQKTYTIFDFFELICIHATL